VFLSFDNFVQIWLGELASKCPEALKIFFDPEYICLISGIF